MTSPSTEDAQLPKKIRRQQSGLEAIRNALRNARSIRVQFTPPNFFGGTAQLEDLILLDHSRTMKQNHPNPLNRAGKKCFSQSDEDGITLEILRRIGQLDEGVFAEFGVGDGTENNTLILAALGWKGFWVGGQDLIVPIEGNSSFVYEKAWITAENILALGQSCMQKINATQVDVMCLDLDGNDIYLVEKLLMGGMQPKLFIVEYNAKFPPPVKFQIAYDPDHVWGSDDYYGASLSSFIELFERFGYSLVCCNSHTGCNAFFIEDRLLESFADVPTDVNQLYAEPRYFLYKGSGYARTSIRTVAKVIGMSRPGGSGDSS